MRLVDAYRRIHPRTSDSDESTVHSTQTNETELSPLLGDEALAWIQDRVASAHEREANDDLSTTSTRPRLRARLDRLDAWIAGDPPVPTTEELATSVVVNDLGAVSTSPVARRQGAQRMRSARDRLSRARSLGPGRPGASIPPVAATCVVAHQAH